MLIVNWRGRNRTFALLLIRQLLKPRSFTPLLTATSVRPEGFEPSSCRLKVCCVTVDTTTSIQLGSGFAFETKHFFHLQLLICWSQHRIQLSTLNFQLSTLPSGSSKNRTWHNPDISRAWATGPQLPFHDARFTPSLSKWFGRRSNPYLLGFNQALYRLSYQTHEFAKPAQSPSLQPTSSNSGLAKKKPAVSDAG